MDVNLSIKNVGGPEVFPSREGMAAISEGLVDAGFTATAYHVGVVPEGDAAKLSRLYPWEERESGAYDLLNKYHQEKANVYYLWRYANQPYFNLYLNVLRETPDLTGLKIRSTPIYDPLIKALGGTPISIAPPEVYTALERGIVDGYGWAAVRISDRKWDEVTKYIWGPRFYVAGGGIFVNLDSWNGLSEEQRAFLTTIGLEMERETSAAWEKLVKEDRELLADLGVEEIRFIPADEKKYLDLAYEAGWEAVIAKVPEVAKLKPLMSK